MPQPSPTWQRGTSRLSQTLLEYIDDFLIILPLPMQTHQPDLWQAASSAPPLLLKAHAVLPCKFSIMVFLQPTIIKLCLVDSLSSFVFLPALGLLHTT